MYKKNLYLMVIFENDVLFNISKHINIRYGVKSINKNTSCEF